DADPQVARRGIAVHRLLQWLTDGMNDERQLRQRLSAQLALTRAEFGPWLGEARTLIAQPALAHLFAREKFRQAWNEVPLQDGDSLGVIDRLVDDGQTLWVIDYKTQRDADDAALLAHYAPQLRAYAAGAAKLYAGRKVQAGLLLTYSARWLPLPGE
ncbi:MAG TPA: PD-(D/E)XK nuclease family protein, partial [Nevskiaceae bacterium]|nr:PD-(D/E)XK nuclease family protein [Nevskiaceae bacterium]